MVSRALGYLQRKSGRQQPYLQVLSASGAGGPLGVTCAGQASSMQSAAEAAVEAIGRQGPFPAESEVRRCMGDGDA